TAVAFANRSESDAAVRLDLTSLDGRLLGTSTPIRIQPNGQVAMFLNQVPGFETLTGAFTGFLRVTATSGAITAAGLRAMSKESCQERASGCMPKLWVISMRPQPDPPAQTLR